MRNGTPNDPRRASLSEEANPTPLPAPERIASTKRELADFWFACTEREAERRLDAELGVRRPHASDCDCIACVSTIGVHP